jgi:hypothetical protein
MNAYKDLLRDLAEQEPRHGFLSASDVQLTDRQAAIVVREYPDVVAEAIAGHEQEIALAMSASDHPRFDVIACGSWAALQRWIREKCASYILSDLMAYCDELAEARRIDRRFEVAV